MNRHRPSTFVPCSLLGVALAIPAGAESYESWRQSHWNAPQHADESISGMAADPDSDGFANGVEYKLGTDPRRADDGSVLAITAGPNEVESDHELRVDYGIIPARDSIALEVESTDDPAGAGAWNTDSVRQETRAQTSGSIRRRASIPVEGSGHFLRWRMEDLESQASYIWWEAEDHDATSGTSEETHEVLSGQRWILLDEVSEGAPRYVEYHSVEVPIAGTYHFYARKFWRHGPYSWSFNQREQEGQVPFEIPLLDQATLRLFWSANWTYAGAVTLPAGTHHLRVEIDPPAPGHNQPPAAFDAFLLTPDPFPFRGRYQPHETISATEEGWFPWHADVDPYEYSPIDLRFLNEETAGDGGFISVQGEDFVHSTTGETVRFWGLNGGPDVAWMDRWTARLYARHLAKMGVNLVRIHGAVYDGSGADFDDFREAHLDHIHAFIAALKEEGIYTVLSIYFPLWIEMSAEDPRFPGYSKGQHPFAIPFFHPEFQAIYRGWWEQLLTAVNPYTGVALIDEPALHSVELVNEDSLFFWTFSESNVPDPMLRLLETRFANWLVDRFGSLDDVAVRWGGFGESRDAPADGRIGFQPLCRIAFSPDDRSRDTARFLTEVQRTFFQESYDYLKDDLGLQSLIYASNWITANDVTLGPLDKYSNTVGDFMDRHGYFEPLHRDEGDFSASYSIREGHRYRNRSALRFSSTYSDDEDNFANPLINLTYDGLPAMISEVNWPMPNRFRADMPFLFSTFGRVQGIDAVVNFVSSARPWLLEQEKFPMHTPVTKAQFPAAALAYRRGYVAEGAVVAEAVLPLEGHLYQLEGSPLALAPSLDQLRSPGSVDPGEGSVNPLAFLTGRARIEFTDSGEFSEQLAFAPYLDLEAGTIRSSTDELLWDFGQGYARVDTPKLQGITGFLHAAGTQNFQNVTITSSLEYGTIWLISMDDRPIEDSRRLLLLAMSEERANGWQTENLGEVTIEGDDGPVVADNVLRITDLGGAPMMIRNLAGQISLQVPEAGNLVITRLDQNGYRMDLHAEGGGFDLHPTTIYYLIERKR